MENNRYPTDEELERIGAWDSFDMKGLIEFILSIWWCPEWGFRCYPARSYPFRERCWKLQLHTGGWSGNEDIIEALQGNFIFWAIHWKMNRIGGHYTFEFKPSEVRGLARYDGNDK